MTGPTTTAGRSAGWPAALDALGRRALLRSFPDPQPNRDPPGELGADSGAAATREVVIRELFVRADGDLRKSTDLLCVVRLEREPIATGQPSRHELVFVGPDRISGHVTTTSSGVRAADLRVTGDAAGLRSVSLTVLQTARGFRVRDVVASLESLGTCLDYTQDPVGSDAVAAALVRRLEALAAIPGADAVLAGVVDLTGPGGDRDGHHLLLSRHGPALLDVDLEVRAGRVVVAGRERQEHRDPAGAASSWQEHDFALLRVGSTPSRTAPARSLTELRQRYALAEVGVDEAEETEEQTGESWSSFARRARAVADADRIVRGAVGGDLAAAGEALDTALRRSDSGAELADQLGARIRTVKDFWAVETVLAEGRTRAASADSSGGEVVAAVASLTEASLTALASILGFRRGTSDELSIPIVTPLVLEVGEALQPFVDSRQDGGTFLYELVPWMRDRIEADTGVTITGVRARGAAALEPPTRFAVQVAEVPRRKGTLAEVPALGVRSWPGGPPPAGATTATLHPVTGETGVWLISPLDTAPGDAGRDRAQPVSVAQMLIHHIETVVRADLAHFLGPQEVDTLAGRWATGPDAALVAAVVPDGQARLRLTWLLQDLVREGVPLTRPSAILEAVRDRGGLDRPTAELQQEVRVRLGPQLPGPRSGELLISLPAHLEAAVTTGGGTPRAADDLAVLTWLRGLAADRGPVFSVLTGGHEARERVAVHARGHLPLVTTFCRAELEAP